MWVFEGSVFMRPWMTAPCNETLFNDVMRESDFHAGVHVQTLEFWKGQSTVEAQRTEELKEMR